LLHSNVIGQSLIKGKVVDSNWQTLDSVQISNIHSRESLLTDTSGSFNLTVEDGQLIQLYRKGYKKLRLRIANAQEPTYYVLTLEKSKPLLDVKGYLLAYELDSLEYDRIYGVIVNGERIEDVDMRSLPLAALSKQNRKKWAFQKLFAKWQSEKYIDYVFNEELVKKITYLKGNDLRRFMSSYRPSVNFLRSSTEYEYLSYIKRAYQSFVKEEKY